MTGIASDPRARSAILSRILQQMEQTQQYQPQSWGALAAGLGSAYLEKKALEKELEKAGQARSAQSQQVAQALGQYGAKSQGGPTGTVIGDVAGGPGTPLQSQYLPDQQGAQTDLLAKAMSNIDNPGFAALAGPLLKSQFDTEASPYQFLQGAQGQVTRANKKTGKAEVVIDPQAQADAAKSRIGKIRSDYTKGLMTKEDFDIAMKQEEKKLSATGYKPDMKEDVIRPLMEKVRDNPQGVLGLSKGERDVLDLYTRMSPIDQMIRAATEGADAALKPWQGADGDWYQRIDGKVQKVPAPK